MKIVERLVFLLAIEVTTAGIRLFDTPLAQAAIFENKKQLSGGVGEESGFKHLEF